MALQPSDILIVLLFVAIVIFSIVFFYVTNRRPALAYLLAIYTPFQNVILPIIFAWTTLPSQFGVALLTLKDSLLVIGLLFCLANVNHIAIKRVDILGLLFVAFLFVNFIFSDSEIGAALRALRSFAIPVALYAFGRLSITSTLQLDSFVKIICGVSVIVMILASVDYILVVIGADPILPSPQEYLADFYGLLGSQEQSRFASGFLGHIPKLIGPFGNNLIMAAFLRTTICAFIFYLVRSGRNIRTTDIIFLITLFVASALTLSRFAIASLYVIGFLLLVQRALWNKAGKAIALVCFVIATAFAWNILTEVATTTLRIEDESTFAHVDSLVELSSMELSIFGHGLGLNADSKGMTRALQGEGYIRQFTPEIGIFGVTLFLLFAISAVFSLVKFKDLTVTGIQSLPARFWIVLPIMLEILHAPIDTGIQSFLANGLTWLLLGMVVTFEQKNPPPN